MAPPIESKPTVTRRTTLQKRHGDLLRIRLDSRDELINKHRANKARINATTSSLMEDSALDEFPKPVLDTWFAYLNVLALPYTAQEAARQELYERLNGSSWLRVAETILQEVQLDMVCRIVDLLIEVSTSTWDGRDSYISETLEILLQLSAPLENDPLRLYAASNLTQFFLSQLQSPHQLSIGHAISIAELIGNMATNPEAFSQFRAHPALLRHLCAYAAQDPKHCDEAVIWAILVLINNTNDMSPDDLAPVATNIERFLDYIADAPYSFEKGTISLLEILRCLMDYNPQYVKNLFGDQLIAKVLHAAVKFTPRAHAQCAKLFAHISFLPAGYDLVLAGNAEFMKHIENRLLSRDCYPDERISLFSILTNLVVTTHQYSILTKSWSIKEVVATALEQGTGAERLEANFLWQSCVRQVEQIEELEECLTPIGGFETVEYLHHGLQFKDSQLNENTLYTLSHVLSICAQQRFIDGRPGRFLLERLFGDGVLRRAVEAYFEICDDGMNANLVLSQLDAFDGVEDEEPEYTEPDMPQDLRAFTERLYNPQPNYSAMDTSPLEMSQTVDRSDYEEF